MSCPYLNAKRGDDAASTASMSPELAARFAPENVAAVKAMNSTFDAWLPSCAKEVQAVNDCRAAMAKAGNIKRVLWYLKLADGHCLRECHDFDVCRGRRSTIEQRALKLCGGYESRSELVKAFQRCRQSGAKECQAIFDLFTNCIHRNTQRLHDSSDSA